MLFGATAVAERPVACLAAIAQVDLLLFLDLELNGAAVALLARSVAERHVFRPATGTAVVGAWFKFEYDRFSGFDDGVAQVLALLVLLVDFGGPKRLPNSLVINLNFILLVVFLTSDGLGTICRRH